MYTLEIRVQTKGKYTVLKNCKNGFSVFVILKLDYDTTGLSKSIKIARKGHDKNNEIACIFVLSFMDHFCTCASYYYVIIR